MSHVGQPNSERLYILKFSLGIAMISVRYVATVAALFFSSSAFAGSVGLLTYGGLHEGKAYYYDSDGLQGIDSQFRPHIGYGLEATLGDKDNRLLGLIRFQNNYDWPLEDPDVKGDDYTHPPYSDTGVDNDGMISIGLQWSLWGDPTGFQLIGTTSLTAGFWTKANTEYFLPEAGLGATYTINDAVQVHSTVAGGVRYRKGMLTSGNFVVGVRYLFD